MVLNLYDQSSEWPHWFRKILLELRVQHTAEGGDPKEFTDYLAENGIETTGPYINIDPKWESYATLKYENK